MLIPELYLGSYANDAAAESFVTGNGWSVATGMYYKNTTDSKLKWYDGSSWVDLT